MASRNEVAAFWRWFQDNRSELESKSLSPVLIERLEQHLFRVHRLDWEIGPGREQPNSFALSPSGDRELLAVTRGIIEQAPQLEGWELHAAKPPRAWNLVFSMEVRGRDVRIDAKEWEFVAYMFPDRTYDLLFKPTKLANLSNDDLHLAAQIIVDGELGEGSRIELIGCIELVEEWDEKAARSARKLEPGLLAMAMGIH